MARIGVFICECGGNITEKVNFDRVIEEIILMPDVAIVEPFRLMCSPDGKSYLERRIVEERLTHVVVAACSPRDHQQTFMRVCEKAGLNPYLMQLVNIREQCAWVTEDPRSATEKATRMIKAAVSRVRFQSPLMPKSIAMNQDILVVGGGIGGIEAALELAKSERRIYLVESTAQLGGMAVKIQSIHSKWDFSSFLKSRIDEIGRTEGIETLLEFEVEQVLGFFGNFEVRVRSPKEDGPVKELKVGAIVLATGAALFEPKMNVHSDERISRVITAMEFEEMNRGGRLSLMLDSPPATIAIVHCVGRDATGYCSEICCNYSFKISRDLRSRYPDVRIMHVYPDICIPGKESQRYMEGSLGPSSSMLRGSDVRIGEHGKALDYVDAMGVGQSASIDLVILAPAMIPSPGTKELAETVGVSLDRDGFFAKRHDMLHPVSTTLEGVFAIGCCQGPKGISDTIAQAKAAAGAISATLVRGRSLETETRTAQVAEDYCQGCGLCVSVCPFGAIELDERRKVAKVNDVICRGCGNCASACPSGAATLKHSTFEQIYQEIEEAIR